MSKTKKELEQEIASLKAEKAAKYDPLDDFIDAIWDRIEDRVSDVANEVADEAVSNIELTVS